MIVNFLFRAWQIYLYSLSIDNKKYFLTAKVSFGSITNMSTEIAVDTGFDYDG